MTIIYTRKGTNVGGSETGERWHREGRQGGGRRPRVSHRHGGGSPAGARGRERGGRGRECVGGGGEARGQWGGRAWVGRWNPQERSHRKCTMKRPSPAEGSSQTHKAAMEAMSSTPSKGTCSSSSCCISPFFPTSMSLVATNNLYIYIYMFLIIVVQI